MCTEVDAAKLNGHYSAAFFLDTRDYARVTGIVAD
jgi:hypothetical protein